MLHRLMPHSTFPKLVFASNSLKVLARSPSNRGVLPFFISQSAGLSSSRVRSSSNYVACVLVMNGDLHTAMAMEETRHIPDNQRFSEPTGNNDLRHSLHHESLRHIPSTQDQEVAGENGDLIHALYLSKASFSEEKAGWSLLHQDLHKSSQQAEALLLKIGYLSDQKRKAKEAAASLTKSLEELHAESMVAMDSDNNSDLSENLSEINSNHTCKADFGAKCRLLESRHFDKKKQDEAIDKIEARFYILCFETERLQLQKAEYLKEVCRLNGINADVPDRFKSWRTEGNATPDEIENILYAKAMAEQKISDAKAAMADLNLEISKVMEIDGDLKHELDEAKDRIYQLQQEDTKLSVREMDMESRISELEGELHALRAKSGSNLHAFEKDRCCNGSLRNILESVNTQKKEIERDLDCSKAALADKDYEAKDDVHRVSKLQIQVAQLLEQKEALATINADLETRLMKLQCGSEKVEDIESDTKDLHRLKKHIQSLENALQMTKQKACALEEREALLRQRIDELTDLAERNQMLSDIFSPILLSGSAIVVAGIVVFLLYPRLKQN